MQRLYLLHPLDLFLPGISESITEIAKLFAADESWSGWTLTPIHYDEQNNFSARDVNARVVSDLGPVVILEPVQTPAKERLRTLLRSRSVVVVSQSIDPTDIWQDLELAKQRFDTGEPFLPRKFVVAILILRKLIKGDYWGGGAKNKAYAYADELAKGRGVDDQYADVASEVANVLRLNDLLKSKPGNNRTKYALNSDRRAEILAAAEHCDFQDERLRNVLMRDTREVSARELD